MDLSGFFLTSFLASLGFAITHLFLNSTNMYFRHKPTSLISKLLLRTKSPPETEAVFSLQSTNIFPPFTLGLGVLGDKTKGGSFIDQSLYRVEKRSPILLLDRHSGQLCSEPNASMLIRSFRFSRNRSVVPEGSSLRTCALWDISQPTATTIRGVSLADLVHVPHAASLRHRRGLLILFYL
jgi:hypothetical protein